MNMMSQETYEDLTMKADRLRIKYQPSNFRGLERLAREEYGAVIIITPLVTFCPGITFYNPNYIFYYPVFKGEVHTLSHEIGHLAAGHGTRSSPTEVKEQEADYFAARLNKISLIRLKSYRLLAVIAHSFNSPSLRSADIDREINRLRAKKVPGNIIESMIKIMGLRR